MRTCRLGLLLLVLFFQTAAHHAHAQTPPQSQSQTLDQLRTKALAAHQTYEKDVAAAAPDATTITADIAAMNAADQAYGKAYADQSLSNSDNTNCVDRWDRLRTCFFKAALVIPFRLELTGKHDAYPGISGDIALGSNVLIDSTTGFSVATFVYAGYLASLSSNTSNSTSSGSSSSGNTAGALDIGVGIALPIHSGIDPSSTTTPHIGMVFGLNEAGANKFAYNGKVYTSLVFALDF